MEQGMSYRISNLPLLVDLETIPVLRKVATATEPVNKNETNLP